MITAAPILPNIFVCATADEIAIFGHVECRVAITLTASTHDWGLAHPFSDPGA
jgi:hypothetical protein